MEETAHSKEGKGRNVLIAFDGSEYAQAAMKFFAEFVYCPTDNVLAVYCVELDDIIKTEKIIYSLNEEGVHISIHHDILRDLVQKEIDRIGKKLIEFAAFMKKIKLHGRVKSAHASCPGHGILHVANEIKADLIVIGQRGQSKIRRTVIGSVSDYILHHSSVPVMIVPEPKDKHKHGEASH